MTSMNRPALCEARCRGRQLITNAQHHHVQIAARQCQACCLAPEEVHAGFGELLCDAACNSQQVVLDLQSDQQCEGTRYAAGCCCSGRLKRKGQLNIRCLLQACRGKACQRAHLLILRLCGRHVGGMPGDLVVQSTPSAFTLCWSRHPSGDD